MRQSIPRRVTDTATEVLADQRLSSQPRVGGWPVLAPPSNPRAYVTSGPYQATEAGRGDGLGQVNITESLAKTGVATAGTIASGAAASAIGAGGTFMGIGSVAVAIPVVGAIVAGVILALTLLFNRKGPKQKIATTEIVNKVEPLLQQNLEGYMAGPRNLVSQAQALENFKAGWQYVVDNCDVPVMGEPGQRCVADRQRGGQWDWWSYYYDPIANDLHVKELTAAEATAVAAAAGGSGTGTVADIPVSLLMGVAAIAAALFMGGKK